LAAVINGHEGPISRPNRLKPPRLKSAIISDR
jgi:hypothetical protein